MLMFSHGVSSGWLRETKGSGAEQQPGALAGGDPGVGKEDIGGPGLHHPTFLCLAGDLIPCRERGEVFNVCREIKRKFPLALDDALLDQEVVHRRFVARRQRRISDPGPDRRVGGGEQAEIVGAERHHFPQLQGGALRGELSQVKWVKVPPASVWRTTASIPLACSS